MYSNYTPTLIAILVFFLSLAGGQVAAQQDLRIMIPEGPKPWSSLDINRSEDQFQFAIVTDRTGGRRPGVFMKGIGKLNLLQPEFVMSVGDLIDGYTRDVNELDRQWEEFNGFIDSLQAPFFYVPGNHDITNEVMDSIWQARFGSSYYHFIYKDVLFLCLNSEDQFRGAGRGTISDPQYEYIKKILAENQDVRWTMVFMHQPLWLQQNPERWPEVEQLLAGRQHTVYVGHVHHYVKYLRNNGRYYTLATTGGGSRLRGPQLGEFDHVTWVTMTEDGPIMANLALDGIYSDDLVTEAGYDFISRVSGSDPVRITPLLVEGSKFEQGVVRTEIRNPVDWPVFVQLKPRFNFNYSQALPVDTLTIGPNSVEVIEWELRSRRGMRDMADLGSQLLDLELTYDQPGAHITVPFTYNVAPEERRRIPYHKESIVVDGNLSDWEELPFSYGGEDPEDLQVRWGLQMDDDMLYIAAVVKDDQVLVEEGKSAHNQDAVGIMLSAEAKPMNDQPEFIVIVSPQTSEVKMNVFSPNKPDFEVPLSCRVSPDGYEMEIALPLSFVQEHQGKEWRHLQINMAAQDWDRESDERPQYFWLTSWSSGSNRERFGWFFRE